MAREKPKKISPKKERYLKFRKEKPAMTFASPELSDEDIQLRRQDEMRIGQFWKGFRRPPERYVNERKAKSKR